MPCRWIGCVIIVSLTSTMRSALAVGEAGAARRCENFTPSNDQAKRSMWPVRCSSIVALGLAPVRVVERAPQIGVGQHPAPVVAQPDARIVELRRRRHRLHVHERVARVSLAGCDGARCRRPSCPHGVRWRSAPARMPACGSVRPSPRTHRIGPSCRHGPCRPWSAPTRGSSAGTGARKPFAHRQRAARHSRCDPSPARRS